MRRGGWRTLRRLSVAHSLLRLCRYDSRREGAYGTDVLCEEHHDVGALLPPLTLGPSPLDPREEGSGAGGLPQQRAHLWE